MTKVKFCQYSATCTNRATVTIDMPAFDEPVPVCRPCRALYERLGSANEYRAELRRLADELPRTEYS